ncbi:MAG: lysylphosphatidylglycerol synthase transmembrane domain-containing protein [Bacteroidia bacterium]
MNKKNITTLIKILIGVLCILLIAQRLYNSYSPENLQSVQSIFSSENYLLLTVTCLLMTVNWGIEVWKWKIITAPIQEISFLNAWRSVWTGVCIGNLTPGRLGEFAGRIMFYQPQNRAKVATSHFVSGITQLVITIVMGCLGLLVFSNVVNFGFFVVTLAGEIILLVILIWALANLSKLISKVVKFSFLKKFDFEGLSFSKNILSKLLSLSALRYFVFSFQFYLLLHCCNISGSFFEISAAIAIMYLLLSTIPMISFAEVGVRAYVAVLLFKSFEVNEWQLSAIATLLWFINIAIPSLIGYIFILKNNFSFTKQKNAVD